MHRGASWHLRRETAGKAWPGTAFQRFTAPDFIILPSAFTLTVTAADTPKGVS
jgi:hypothetical protein